MMRPFSLKLHPSLSGCAAIIMMATVVWFALGSEVRASRLNLFSRASHVLPGTSHEAAPLLAKTVEKHPATISKSASAPELTRKVSSSIIPVFKRSVSVSASAVGEIRSSGRKFSSWVANTDSTWASKMIDLETWFIKNGLKSPVYPEVKVPPISFIRTRLGIQHWSDRRIITKLEAYSRRAKSQGEKDGQYLEVINKLQGRITGDGVSAKKALEADLLKGGKQPSNAGKASAMEPKK